MFFWCSVVHVMPLKRDIGWLACGFSLGAALQWYLLRNTRSVDASADTSTGTSADTSASSASSAATTSTTTTALPFHPRIRLTYLDIKGVAEPIRLAMYVGGLLFEDRRVSYDDVAVLRAEGALPFGQVPLLELMSDDGTVVERHAQSGALLRWAGRRVGWLYPPALRLRVDAVEEALADIKMVLRPQWYGHVLGRSPVSGAPLVALNAAQRAQTAALLGEEVLPARFKQLERLVGGVHNSATEGLSTPAPGPFFCGAALTICDLSFFVIGEGLLDDSFCTGVKHADALLDDCPRLRALLAAVAAHPKVMEWNRLCNAVNDKSRRDNT